MFTQFPQKVRVFVLVGSPNRLVEEAESMRSVHLNSRSRVRWCAPIELLMPKNGRPIQSTKPISTLLFQVLKSRSLLQSASRQLLLKKYQNSFATSHMSRQHPCRQHLKDIMVSPELTVPVSAMLENTRRKSEAV